MLIAAPLKAISLAAWDSSGAAGKMALKRVNRVPCAVESRMNLEDPAIGLERFFLAVQGDEAIGAQGMRREVIRVDRNRAVGVAQRLGKGPVEVIGLTSLVERLGELSIRSDQRLQ